MTSDTAEPIENIGESDLSASLKPHRETPTITDLLHRKKAGENTAAFSAAGPAVIAQGASSDRAASEPVIQPAKRRRKGTASSGTQGLRAVTRPTFAPGAERKPGEPPPFNKALVLDSLSVRELEIELRKHRLAPHLCRLDLLGYFAARFSQVAYFRFDAAANRLAGELGFGSPWLVSGIRSQRIDPAAAPQLFKIIARMECAQEPVAGLDSLGFTDLRSVGVFTMHDGSNVRGVWVCAGAVDGHKIPPSEMRKLKALLVEAAFQGA